MNKKAIKVFKQGKEPKPYEYWLTQEPHKRIEALEQLRKQYYGTERRLQRVLTITKLKKS